MTPLGLPIVCQTVPDSPWMVYLRVKVPGLTVVEDQHGDAYLAFVDALRAQGDRAGLQIEDDIILTRGFFTKVAAVIAVRPAVVINFFSLRDDAAKGPRWDRRFSMNQCTYYPAGYAAQIATFAETWARPPGSRGYRDSMVRAFLHARHEPHWLHTPSLVQHREAPSRLGPRSSHRQSPTFTDPDY